MTDRQETIADIIAEMKREAEKIFPALPIAVLQLATRIEAAHDHDIAIATEASARAVVGACVKQQEAERERDEMLDALVRISNWCAQDLAENAYVSDSSGNYLTTLNGLCEVCRPFMQKASELKRYGGANG